MTSVDLIYFNAGGGHRAAATALQQAMRQLPWQVRLVNLVDLLDTQSQFYNTLGIQPEDLYNKRLANGMTLGMAHELKLLQWMIRLGHKTMVGKLQAQWASRQPDLVVSLIPNFNRALCESLTLARPATPYVTVLTDMADHPPNFWIEPDQPQQLICGTAFAAQQARTAGCAAQRIHTTSGMVLSPRFYDLPPLNRTDERQKLGLTERQPVGVVMFGGYGSDAMKRIAASLPDIPLILMCGKNAALAQALRQQTTPAPRVVVEYTDDVPHLLRLGDFFIGKPGPASLSEAVQLGLPVIVTRNAWTMPQERWNTEWVTTHGLGVVLKSFRTIRAAVTSIAHDLPQWQHNVRQMHNRAVFEVPVILEQLLARSSYSSTCL